MKNYNYIDLFHGIGGFALGAHLAGMQFENHFCSDVEPYCQKLYALLFPDSVQLGDIRTIDTDALKQEYGDKWIISGGFPCQDISVAGKGAGIHGERSGLWFEYWRLIRDLRPRFAIMENVGALAFRGLDVVLGSLAEIGYNAEWQDIRASDMGAPHRRERIWIIAYPRSEQHESGRNEEQRERAKEFFEDVADPQELRRRQGDQVAGGTCEGTREEKERCRFTNGSTISDAVRQGLQIARYAGKVSQGEDGVKTRSAVDGNSWWSTEPDVGRVAHGVPARVDRLRGLGNAIVPQIAGMLFGLIKDQL